jgi:hypothetical protein
LKFGAMDPKRRLQERGSQQNEQQTSGGEGEKVYGILVVARMVDCGQVERREEEMKMEMETEMKMKILHVVRVCVICESHSSTWLRNLRMVG